MSHSFSIIALEGDLLNQASELIGTLGEPSGGAVQCKDADEFTASLREGALGVCRQGNWTWILDPGMVLGTVPDHGVKLSARLNVRVVSCFHLGASGDCGFHLSREGGVLRSWEHLNGVLQGFGEVLPEESAGVDPRGMLMHTLRNFGFDPERLESGNDFRIYG